MMQYPHRSFHSYPKQSLADTFFKIESGKYKNCSSIFSLVLLNSFFPLIREFIRFLHLQRSFYGVFEKGMFRLKRIFIFQRFVAKKEKSYCLPFRTRGLLSEHIYPHRLVSRVPADMHSISIGNLGNSLSRRTNALLRNGIQNTSSTLE